MSNIVLSTQGFSGIPVIYNTVFQTLPDFLWRSCLPLSHCWFYQNIILLHNRGNMLKAKIFCNINSFPQPTVAKMEIDGKSYFNDLLLFLFDLQYCPSNTKWYSSQRLILHKRNTMEVILKVSLLYHGLIPHTKT